jgi:ABC-type branched-subunit amino acid transport system ATPase component
VLDNLKAGAMSANSWKAYLTDPFWMTPQMLPAPAWRAVIEFGLEDSLERKPSELPYGRRRLVSIARALATNPSVLLLDEPAAGLSDAESEELRVVIQRLRDEWGLGILLIEHDMSLVMSTCDRVIVLDGGRKIADDLPTQIKLDSTVRAAYLGPDADESTMRAPAAPVPVGIE